MVLLVLAIFGGCGLLLYFFGFTNGFAWLGALLLAGLGAALVVARRKISNDSRVADVYLRLRSFLSSPANLFVSAFLITGFGACWGLGGFGTPPIGYGPTILVGSVALGGWLFTSGINLQNRVSQFTLSILFGPRLDKTMLESAKLLFKFCPEKKMIEKIKIEALLESEDIDGTLELRAAISTVMNYYEALALAVRHREADEVVLRLFYRGMLCGELEKYQNYVVYYRRKGSERAFYNWEWLVRRWDGAALSALDEYKQEKRSH